MAAPLDLKTLEAAATWYVQLNDGAADEARTRAWQTWLHASPQHAAAWARVEALQQQWARMPQRAALSGLGAAQQQRRDVLKILGMLMAVGAGSWLAVEQVPYRSMLAGQRTRSGERRSLQLDDGTRLEMNVDTSLDIQFDGQQRLIQLYQGEILVQTAKDPAQRPFSVTTSDGNVRALGTRFSVRQWGDHTEVGVEQAAVEVRPRRNDTQRLTLEAGQHVSFDRDAIGRPRPLPQGSTAWVQGMLSVDDWRLGDFITQLGRYRPGVLRCAPQVQNLSISGAFRIDDTDTVLQNLGKSLPVKVTYLTRYWVSIEAL
ncbi:FecR domain-containing protein [Pseudomonas sp. FP453]|uniref:FecR domain-containing protein n=1 Tax=Pseudomonas sp. FP453 TaxID=2954094 RepID=UPI0027375287|nr:FecR domain-containing protein [Pseudomonas sp. FP453]WLH90724.1 FecR domain-containing protein [Pseudomonas sp. FP453]